MVDKPRLNQCYHLESLASDEAFLLSEWASIELGNFWYKLLLPLVNGDSTSQEIVTEVLPYLVGEETSIEDAVKAGAKAFYALDKMAQQGYITENDPHLPDSLVAFCDALNVDTRAAYYRLQTTQVAVKTLGAVSPLPLISLLESLHIKVADCGDREIVLTDDYLQAGLAKYNQEALQSNRAWMLIKPSGMIGWIGPIFRPDKTACWECLAVRLRGNRPVEQFIMRQKGQTSALPIPQASLLSTEQTLLNLAATEVFKWIVLGNNPALEGKLITYDALSLKMDTHILVKRPQCPSCGIVLNPFNSQPLPLVLGRRKKTFRSDGGHRCFSPEETLKKHQHHISSITGIVRSLEKVSPNNSPLFHSYVARHHFSASFDDLKSLRQNITGRSAGKGKTEIQAKASAFCEAIERYAGGFQGDELRRKSSYQNLGDKAIHPNNCLNFSATQYANRQEWNETCPSLWQRIPVPFDETIEREWSSVWSLTYQDFKYLPTAYCYYGYPNATSDPDCWSDTNGCASGNTLEEAILQGFMELVERDSVAIWWYNCLKRPAVDLESFDDPYFQALKTYYRNLGRELWVLDLTSDLNIPTFAALSRRIDSEVEDIVLGYGTHFDPIIAIGRALTEVNQILPAVLSSNADGTTRYLSYDALAVEWWKTATVANQPYLLPDTTLPLRVRSDYSIIEHDDLFEDITLCQQIAQKHNLEILVLEQTRSDIGLKVAKVIVPGLRHFWRRLGAGRLYDVPVKLGWLKTPLPEEQLNSFPMWM